jgi:hypothetical protein
MKKYDLYSTMSRSKPRGGEIVFSRSFKLASIVTFGLWLSACAPPEFDEGAIRGQLESAPQNLSGEQVTLTEIQVDCGAKNELWEPPNGNVARLIQKGRDLKFSDDVRLNDPDIRVPYIQVSGTFPVVVADVSKLRDAGKGFKLADVKLGITIAHECFATPLPLMGVRKGKFTPEAPVVFRFQGSGKEWSLDKLVH